MHEEDEGSLQAVDDGEDKGHHCVVPLDLQEAQAPRAAQDTDVRQCLERHQPDRIHSILLFLVCLFFTPNPILDALPLPPPSSKKKQTTTQPPMRFLPMRKKKKTQPKTHRVFFMAVTSALREESLSRSVQRVVR